MPAASCSFSQTSAASRLARSRSAPSRRHAGHELFGLGEPCRFRQTARNGGLQHRAPTFGSSAAASILRAAMRRKQAWRGRGATPGGADLMVACSAAGRHPFRHRRVGRSSALGFVRSPGRSGFVQHEAGRGDGLCAQSSRGRPRRSRFVRPPEVRGIRAGAAGSGGTCAARRSAARSGSFGCTRSPHGGRVAGCSGCAASAGLVSSACSA